MTGDDPGHRNADGAKPPLEGLSVELRVPGTIHYLQILRTVIARAGLLLDFSFDGIEDLALLVDEAAVLLMESEPDGLVLRLADTDSGALQIHLATSQPTERWPLAELETDMRWQIVGALADDARLLTGPVTGIEMTRAPR